MSPKEEWDSTLQKRPMSSQFWFNSLFLSEACNAFQRQEIETGFWRMLAVEWYFSERVIGSWGMVWPRSVRKRGVRTSVCKYVRQNTVITARLIPPVRTLQMKINPLGLEEKSQGINVRKLSEKNRPESWLFFLYHEVYEVKPRHHFHYMQNTMIAPISLQQHRKGCPNLQIMQSFEQC